MKISVIIPAYNEECNIENCLITIFKSDYPRTNYEVIVVDNNSTDTTKAIVSKFDVKYIWIKERNRSLARNRGLDISAGELIAYIDADVLIDPTWLREMAAMFEHSNLDACQGEIKLKSSNKLNSLMTTTNKIRKNRIAFGENWPCVIDSCCSMYRKKTLKEIKGFNVSLNTAEDLDLTLKLISNGKLLKWDSRTCATKIEDRNLHQYIARSFHKGIATGHLLVCRWRIISRLEAITSALLSIIKGIISVATFNKKATYFLSQTISQIGMILGSVPNKSAATIFNPVQVEVFYQNTCYGLEQNSKLTIINNKIALFNKARYFIANAEDFIAAIEGGHPFNVPKDYIEIVEHLVSEKILVSK